MPWSGSHPDWRFEISDAFASKEVYINKSGGHEMQIKNVASSEITICDRTYDEYIEMVKAFHGHIAPERL